MIFLLKNQRKNNVIYIQKRTMLSYAKQKTISIIIPHTRNFSYKVIKFNSDSPHYDKKKHLTVIDNEALENKNTSFPANRLTHAAPGIRHPTDKEVTEIVPIAPTDLKGNSQPQNLAWRKTSYTRQDIDNAIHLKELDEFLADGTPLCEKLKKEFARRNAENFPLIPVPSEQTEELTKSSNNANMFNNLDNTTKTASENKT